MQTITVKIKTILRVFISTNLNAMVHFRRLHITLALHFYHRFSMEDPLHIHLP